MESFICAIALKDNLRHLNQNDQCKYIKVQWFKQIYGVLSKKTSYNILKLWRSRNFPLLRALLNLLKRRSRPSKPATNPQCKHINTTVGISTISKPYWTVFYRIKMSTTNVSELGYLFLPMSSLHKIASDLDVRDRLPWWMKAKLEWCKIL